jgi:hypothetical protein
MEKMNKFISLLLVFSMLLPSIPAFAVNQPGAEEAEELPQNPPGTPAGVQCTGIGVKPGTNGVCCVGLELNSAGMCDELVFSDPALKSCSSQTECSGGTGCYPQSASDLFSSASPSTDDKDELSENYKSVQAQVAEVETFKAVGATCAHARECSSYSCVSGVCKDAAVCRYAKEGEVAGGGVNCAPELIKDGSGKCQKDPNAKNAVYLGLLKEATIEDQGQCRFELDEETRKRAIIAMSSLRAMEWFYSTVNMSSEEDCFSVAPVLKDAIGKPFYETRKNILTNFTDVLNGIEFDFKQLIEAKEKSEKSLTIHNGEQIKEGDLATRQTSGYDNLVMMYRRNLLFQSYEQSMLGTVQAANVTLGKVAKGMNSWQGGSSSWDLMGQQLSYNCEGSKYKVKPFLKWKTKYYTKVQDRWANYWEVAGSAAGNADIVKRDNVKKNLALFAGISEDEAVSTFTKKFYMIDPLMFAGMKQGQYGSAKALKKKSGFLGLFGGFKDLRHAYTINGGGSGSFSSMHSQLKPRIREFYKGLKTNASQKNFIYEPELVTTSAKSCLDGTGATEKCSDFEKFLDDTLDEAFAQFLAYGHSSKDSYEGYFESASSYRRRLFAKLEVDMANISKYYETVIEQRNKQNACIEKVVGGIVDSGILVTDGNGVNEGGSVSNGSVTNGSGAGSGPNGAGVSALGQGTQAAKLQSLKLSPLTRQKFSFDLTGNTLKKLNDVSNLDSLSNGGLDSSSAKIGASEQAFLAARKDAMNKANSKASSNGVNVAKKEKAVSDIINSMKKTASSSNSSMSGSGSSGSGSRSGFGNINAGQAGLGKDLKGAGELSNGEIGVGADTQGKGAAGADDGNATGTGANALAGIDAGAAGGFGAGGAGGADASGAGAGAGAGGKDGTGLSDAEKERLMSEYQKNKKDYEGSEEDGLFGKVSKAYVRNLDKVLNKKKKIDNN